MIGSYLAGHVSAAAAVVISIALMLFTGFAATRVTKRLRLPDVTAYILSGILLGPCCLGLVPQTVIDGMDFLPDVALAFIAFSTGEFFQFSTLKKNGLRVVVVTVAESLLASAAVFALTWGVLGLDLSFSIALAVIKKTGISLSRLSAWHTQKPSPSGSMISSSTKSNSPSR